MAVRKTEALVLRQIPYADADRIAHFLTAESGMVHAFVKGARRLRSKFAGSIDLMNLGTLVYYERSSDTLVRVHDFDVSEGFPTIKGDVYRFYRAQLMVELAHAVSDRAHTDRNLFKMLVTFLKTMERSENDAASLLVLFLIYAIHHEGYSPLFEQCPTCKKPPVFPLSWSATDGRFSCHRCRGPGTGKQTITAEDVQLFALMKRPNVLMLGKVTMSDDDVARREAFCFDYLKSTVELPNRVILAYRVLRETSTSSREN